MRTVPVLVSSTVIVTSTLVSPPANVQMRWFTPHAFQDLDDHLHVLRVEEPEIARIPGSASRRCPRRSGRRPRARRSRPGSGRR